MGMTDEKWDVLVRAAEAGHFEDDYDTWNVSPSNAPAGEGAFVRVLDKAEALVGCEVPLPTLLITTLTGGPRRLVMAMDDYSRGLRHG